MQSGTRNYSQGSQTVESILADITDAQTYFTQIASLGLRFASPHATRALNFMNAVGDPASYTPEQLRDLATEVDLHIEQVAELAYEEWNLTHSTPQIPIGRGGISRISRTSH